MVKFLTPLYLGLATVSAALPVAQAAEAQQAAPNEAVPYIQGVALSRWVLIALEQAKETNDYSVLSALGSAQFREANPPETLAGIFGQQRQYRTSKLITENPQFTEPPVRTSPNIMTMAGFYVAGPIRERFRLGFTLENGDWRVSELSVAFDELQLPAGPNAGQAPLSPSPNPQ